jgi:hypothetical protein
MEGWVAPPRCCRCSHQEPRQSCRQLCHFSCAPYVHRPTITTIIDSSLELICIPQITMVQDKFMSKRRSCMMHVAACAQP